MRQSIQWKKQREVQRSIISCNILCERENNGKTIERMKEGYSKIRNEALAHAFAYMNLIEHWGSGIPRIIDKVKAAGLRIF